LELRRARPHADNRGSLSRVTPPRFANHTPVFPLHSRFEPPGGLDPAREKTFQVHVTNRLAPSHKPQIKRARQSGLFVARYRLVYLRSLPSCRRFDSVPGHHQTFIIRCVTNFASSIDAKISVYFAITLLKRMNWLCEAVGRCRFSRFSHAQIDISFHFAQN
jgi:hypothetical protein